MGFVSSLHQGLTKKIPTWLGFLLIIPVTLTGGLVLVSIAKIEVDGDSVDYSSIRSGWEPLPALTETYTNEYYKISISYPDAEHFCVAEKCINHSWSNYDEISPSELEPVVRSLSYDDLENNILIFIQMYLNKSGKSATYFGQKSYECTKNDPYGQDPINLQEKGNFRGLDSYEFDAVKGYCVRGYVITPEGIVLGDGEATGLGENLHFIFTENKENVYFIRYRYPLTAQARQILNSIRFLD